MVGFLGRDNWGVGGKHKVDTWVWHQVGLELSDIDVKGTIESKGGSQGRDNLGNDSVEVGVGWSLDVKVSSANIINSFVVDHEGTVRVFQGSMSGQNGVVGLNNSGGYLGCWVDGEFKLGFLAVVDRQAFHQKGGESRSSSSTERVENEKSLKSSTVISQLAYTVKNQINDFLSNGVMTTSIIVGSIFLSSDQLFRMKQLAVSSSSDFINDGGFKIDKDCSWYMFAGSGFREKGVE